MTAWLVALGCVTATWLAAAYALDRYGHRGAPLGRYDVLIVAGCGVMPDGRASPALRRRTELAARLFHEGRAARIVLTGGVGTWPPSEASAAAEVCRELGVPGDALILEELSTSTEQNARCAADLVGPVRALVVSDSYHVFRCERTFRKYFARCDGAGATPPLRQRIRMSLREVGAVISYAARARLRVTGSR